MSENATEMASSTNEANTSNSLMKPLCLVHEIKMKHQISTDIAFGEQFRCHDDPTSKSNWLKFFY